LNYGLTDSLLLKTTGDKWPRFYGLGTYYPTKNVKALKGIQTSNPS